MQLFPDIDDKTKQNARNLLKIQTAAKELQEHLNLI